MVSHFWLCNINNLWNVLQKAAVYLFFFCKRKHPCTEFPSSFIISQSLDFFIYLFLFCILTLPVGTDGNVEFALASFSMIWHPKPRSDGVSFPAGETRKMICWGALGNDCALKTGGATSHCSVPSGNICRYSGNAQKQNTSLQEKQTPPTVEHRGRMWLTLLLTGFFLKDIDLSDEFLVLMNVLLWLWLSYIQQEPL